ncbi:hypothetical protein C8J56DRAFT_1051760 [Mycena floridula]|nr:hypothetical protein C8J56DRAFT_1051760 [Mycena floridula]
MDHQTGESQSQVWTFVGRLQGETEALCSKSIKNLCVIPRKKDPGFEKKALRDGVVGRQISQVLPVTVTVEVTATATIPTTITLPAVTVQNTVTETETVTFTTTETASPSVSSEDSKSFNTRNSIFAGVVISLIALFVLPSLIFFLIRRRRRFRQARVPRNTSLHVSNGSRLTSGGSYEITPFQVFQLDISSDQENRPLLQVDSTSHITKTLPKGNFWQSSHSTHSSVFGTIYEKSEVVPLSIRPKY